MRALCSALGVHGVRMRTGRQRSDHAQLYSELIVKRRVAGLRRATEYNCAHLRCGGLPSCCCCCSCCRSSSVPPRAQSSPRRRIVDGLNKFFRNPLAAIWLSRGGQYSPARRLGWHSWPVIKTTLFPEREQDKHLGLGAEYVQPRA